MMWAIQYFRDPDVVKQYQENGVHDRPVAFVTGTSRFVRECDAQKEANHINEFGPSVPVRVIRVSG